MIHGITQFKQRNDFIAKWNPDEVLKAALRKTSGQNPLAMENLPVFRLAWWPHPQRTVVFCQSFLLVVEINLGKKFGGQACSRGKADQNTTEELLAQNPTILFSPPQTTGLFCAVPGHWSLQLREECSNREDMDGLGKTKSFIPRGLHRGRTLESDGHMNPG